MSIKYVNLSETLTDGKFLIKTTFNTKYGTFYDKMSFIL